MSTKLNNLQTLILSYIAHKEKPSGYDIAKFLSTRTKSQHQAIYRDINKLVDFGFIEFTEIPQDGKPDKKVYSLTKNGEFAKDEMFGFCESDFTKTKAAYFFTYIDIANNCGNLANEYVEAMKKAEHDFYAEHAEKC